jgi:hypothetical protein
MNSFARMTKAETKKSQRRPLTPAEREAAGRFEFHLERSGLTREELATALDLTVGAVGHWAGAIYPIPIDRVARVAELIHADPSEISVRWRENFASTVRNRTDAYGENHTDSGFESLQNRAEAHDSPIHTNLTNGSGNMRPDPVILSTADYWVGLQEAVEGKLYGAPWWERIADMYARIAACGGKLTPQDERGIMAEAMARVLEQQGATSNVRSIKQPGPGDRDK